MRGKNGPEVLGFFSMDGARGERIANELKNRMVPSELSSCAVLALPMIRCTAGPSW